MPAHYLMSWVPKTRRWEKFVKGHRRFVVSCKQLSKHFKTPIPETKEGSYQWANRWWQETASRVAILVQPETHPHADKIAEISGYLDWARKHKPDEAAVLSKHLGTLKGLEEHEEPDLDPLESEVIRTKMEAAKLLGIGIPDDLDPYAVSHFFGSGRIRQDRLARDKAPPVPQDRTVGNLIQRYLDEQLFRHRRGGTSVSEFSNCRAGLLYFRDWIGAEQNVEIMDADKWNAYYLHLIGETAPKSLDTRRKHFRYARSFLTWLDDLAILERPKNLDRRQYRFKGTGNAISTASVAMVRSVINAAKDKGQLQLHLLLMLNCGFTQQDISDLHPSEVDWEQGRIRRKRSKEHDHDNVPVVDYPLWPETVTLLRQFPSGNPNHVLLTESGKTWVRDGVSDTGERSRTDAIRSNYRHLSVPDKPTLKVFRKVGSTMINGSEHGKYATHYLGQVVTVAHKHYINQNGSGFDAAVQWLGEQFGF